MVFAIVFLETFTARHVFQINVENDDVCITYYVFRLSVFENGYKVQFWFRMK